MLKVALFCSTSMVALCAGNPALAAGKPVPLIAHALRDIRPVISASPGSVTLYDQNNDKNGVAIESMNFTDGSFTSFDSAGADDFVIPSGHKWKIKEVDVTGVYDVGPASSENVFFYRNSGGLPGALVAECDNIQGGAGPSFAIKIPKTCKISLKGGRTYWLSVVANVDYLCCGEWGWETRNSQNGYPAAWENPNGGYHACPTWGVMTSCIGDSGEGPDFMFALKGKNVTLQ